MEIYHNAPVSEVIIGITYQRRKFDNKDLFKINDFLTSTYPITEILPPFANEYLDENKIVQSLNIDLTGEVLYRRRSDDRQWLVQIQGNKIYINWIRLDDEKTGNYKGLQSVKDRFFVILEDIKRILQIDCFTDIESYDLTYQDRFAYGEYIDKLDDIKNIINLVVPSGVSSSEECVHFNLQYIYKYLDINEYKTVTINSATNITTKQPLLRFQTVIRGGRGVTFDKWLEIAHKLQDDTFVSMFSEEIRNKWR